MSARQRLPVDPQRATSLPEVAGLAEERQQVLAKVLGKLAPRDRQILRLIFLKERSPDEICAEMGLTETQYRLLKAQAKAKLVKLVDKLPAYERSSRKGTARHPSTPARPVVEVDRLVPVVAHAVAVFGDEHKATHWLVTPLGLLGNRTPLQVLGGGDVEAVDQVLTRIEHNIPS
jgi:uncharacterized protein (DUF2384 family)